ncbi:MAG: Thrombospondin type 3 repeat protein [Myxococcales bacterium]|nr:Thrombospondin type 3 repeat protein [Myxococcales bacterium]
MRNPWGIGAVLGVALVATTGTAVAQSSPPFDPSIDVQTFEYAVGPKTFFTVSNADVAEKKQLAVDAIVTYLTRPFTVYNVDPSMPDQVGSERTQVVKSLAAAQITVAYGVNERLQIGANLPLIFQLTGDGLMPSTGNGDPNGLNVTGLGDLMVEGKYRLYKKGSLKLGGIGGVTLPSSFGSDGSQFIGDDLPTLRGKLAIQYDTGKLSLGANGGFVLRKPRTIYDSTIGQQLTWGVAAAVRITDRFSLIGESYGRAGLPDFSLDASPLEAEAGIRVYVTNAVAVVIGGGAGLVKGIGSPQSRFFLSVGYSPDVRDSDGDGIANVRDKCPLVAEDRDGSQDEDGCPDDDTDGDRRADAEDKCPTQAEDLDGFDDEDGCPELDNDMDKLADNVDKCPNDAEDGKAPMPNDGCPANKRDSDGDGMFDDTDKCPSEEEDVDAFEDGDGCPEADNDKDGVTDEADKCPVCPGVAASGGCPAIVAIQGAGVKVDGDRLIVDKMPTLEKNALSKSGQQIVDQMALVMVSNYNVTKWLIALALPKAPDAAKLAGAVKARLIAKGVPAAYLQVLGAAGPAKIGGIVQERGDDAVPICPAGQEIQQRPDTIKKADPNAKPEVKPEPKQPEPQPEPDIDFDE